MGEPKHARHFCGKLAPRLQCLTDSGTAAYAAYGLRQAGRGELASLELAKAAVRATAAGFLPGQPTGDVKMLPGTFIVDRTGIVRYAYYSAHAGDHPPIADLLRALEAEAAR